MKNIKTFKIFEINALTPDEMGNMILNYVTNKKNKDEIVRLISKGANLNVIDHENENALFVAILYDNIDIFKILIEHDIDLTLKNNEGHNIIDYMFYYGSGKFITWYHTEDAQRIILSKAPSLISSFIKHNILLPNLRKEFAHLVTANDLNLLESNTVKIFNQTVNKSELNQKLLSAVDGMFRNLDLIEELILKGADVNAKNFYDDTPLMIISKDINQPYNVRIMEFIIKSGADLNYKNRDRTFLHYAIVNGFFTSIVKYINKDVNISNINERGDDIISYIFVLGKERDLAWLKTEDAQRTILNNDPALINKFIKHKIELTDEIKKEFAHLITGDELNLL